MSLSASEKIRGAVFGLAFGDAMSFPATMHRLGLLNIKRSARMLGLTQFAFDNAQTTYPTVYTHAQSVDFLSVRPTDDSEWFYFSAMTHLAGDEPIDGWVQLAHNSEGVRGRTGTLMAMDNLKSGKLAPQSGHDNPHYFDDIAMVRALAASLIFRGENGSWLAKAKQDAEVTHSEDGIYCALAFASVASSLLEGENIDVVIERAMEHVPVGTWSHRVVTDALELCASASSILAVSYILEEKVIDRIYSYSISAPETLALVLCYLKVAKSPEDFLLAGTMHKRKLDSMPALFGALAGLTYGENWIPEDFKENSLILDGVCLPSLKGASLSELATRILGT